MTFHKLPVCFKLQWCWQQASSLLASRFSTSCRLVVIMESQLHGKS